MKDEKRKNATIQQCGHYYSVLPITLRKQAISPHHKLGHQRNRELLRMGNDIPERDAVSVIALK